MKILVIRFSSIGDVTQSLSIPSHIHQSLPQAEIHFLTKDSFTELMSQNPHIHKLWTIHSKQSGLELIRFARKLNQENFDYVYDAHNNLRSNIFYFLITAKNKLQKPMERFKRFLLLQFKVNKFEKPFSGQRDLLKPLEKWGIPFRIPEGIQIFLNDKVKQEATALLQKYHVPDKYIAVAPSSAHIFKRWPVDKWNQLFAQMPHEKFVVLAGPADHFTEIFNQHKNIINLTGQTTLMQSAAIIAQAEKVIANDTGLLHFAEQLNKKTIALMGAAPFGFPSKSNTIILKKDLPCWPCSKHGQGPCTNPKYHQCMNDITVDEVKQAVSHL